jgi:ubiquinone/menaquinone biosynthesis C-methylase UbiE
MLTRVLEPEVMDTRDDAIDYDQMDHSAVNQRFVADFFRFAPHAGSPILDVGTGTARIPIEFCRVSPEVTLVAIDLAEQMLTLARQNCVRAGFESRIQIEKANGREFHYATASFPTVVSNSIIHHIPDPYDCLSEMVRVCQRRGVLFVRDLVRPEDEEILSQLVEQYAAGANPHQRQLFADSLRAALTLAEVQSLVAQLGFSPETVSMASDRHWTWAALNG